MILITGVAGAVAISILLLKALSTLKAWLSVPIISRQANRALKHYPTEKGTVGYAMMITISLIVDITVTLLSVPLLIAFGFNAMISTVMAVLIGLAVSGIIWNSMRQTRSKAKALQNEERQVVLPRKPDTLRQRYLDKLLK